MNDRSNMQRREDIRKDYGLEKCCFPDIYVDTVVSNKNNDFLKEL